MKKEIIKLFLIVLVASTVIFSLNPNSLFAVERELKIYVDKDAYTDSSNPNTVYGSTDYLYVSSSNNSRAKNKIYLYFDLTPISMLIPNPIPSVDYIEKVTLHMRNGSINYEIKWQLGGNVSPVTSAWSDYTLTWNNSPSINQSSAVVFTIPCSDFQNYWEWFEINITSLTKSWLKGYMMNNGICLQGGTTSSDTQHIFYSLDHKAGEILCPYLLIQLKPGPHEIFGVVLDHTNDEFVVGVKITLSGDASDVTYSESYPDFYRFYVYNGTYKVKAESPDYVFWKQEQTVTISGKGQKVDFWCDPVDSDGDDDGDGGDEDDYNPSSPSSPEDKSGGCFIAELSRSK